MGQATDAIFAYGIDLGGPDDVWHVQETSEFGSLIPPGWWDEEDDSISFPEAVEDRLREAGVTGVRVIRHCTPNAPEYLLVTHSVRAHRGYPRRLDLEDEMRTQGAADWDNLLAAALTTLGLTSTQDSPGWILAAYAEL